MIHLGACLDRLQDAMRREFIATPSKLFSQETGVWKLWHHQWEYTENVYLRTTCLCTFQLLMVNKIFRRQQHWQTDSVPNLRWQSLYPTVFRFSFHYHFGSGLKLVWWVQELTEKWILWFLMSLPSCQTRNNQVTGEKMLARFFF